MPAICDYRDARIAFGIRMYAPYPFLCPPSLFQELIVHNQNGEPLGACLKIAIERWNRGEFPSDAGEHSNVPIFPEQPVTIDNGYGMQVPMALYVILHVEQQLYFGQDHARFWLEG